MAATFQTAVIAVAAILLLVILAVVGTTMRQGYVDNWPPVVGDCPDYWVDTGSNGSSCVNVHSLGRCNLPGADGGGASTAMDFTQPPYNGDSCAKYKWAQGCGVVWDGLSAKACDAA